MHDVPVHEPLLRDNQAVALENRRVFRDRGIYVCNVMSGPGAGKTSLLERTLAALGARFRMAVIEGDVQSAADAERIARLGVPVHQINTGGACHLDARQVREALRQLPLDDIDALLVENVGNLVCPAEFDLGEQDKVMLLSVAEGHDKPRKYPLMFHVARVLILNKLDLLPMTDFDLDRAVADARDLNFDLEVFSLSCRTGEGLDAWTDWLAARIDRARSRRPRER